jgi:hypothetical protein
LRSLFVIINAYDLYPIEIYRNEYISNTELKITYMNIPASIATTIYQGDLILVFINNNDVIKIIMIGPIFTRLLVSRFVK